MRQDSNPQLIDHESNSLTLGWADALCLFFPFLFEPRKLVIYQKLSQKRIKHEVPTFISFPIITFKQIKINYTLLNIFIKVRLIIELKGKLVMKIRISLFFGRELHKISFRIFIAGYACG
jgi:hypothetical protein